MIRYDVAVIGGGPQGWLRRWKPVLPGLKKLSS